MVQTRRQENARKMEARMQDVEQRLHSVDGLQEMVLGFHNEIQIMGRTFHQEIQALALELETRNIACGPLSMKPMTELSCLRQTGTLAEFNFKFDTISAKLDMPEGYLVGIYVAALKEEISDSVQLFNPRTMLQPRRMARVQEISLLWQSKKKMVVSIKNEQQEKFREPQEPVAKQEGDFKTDQDSFIDIESSLTFNFKTQGLLADGGHASSFSSNTEVESAKISSGINGSSTFDFAEELQALSYHGDRCEVRKQTSSDRGSQLVICRVIGFLNFLNSNTVQPATTTIPSCIGLQLATTFFKWQKYGGSPSNLVRPYGYMGLEDGSGEKNPKELQLCFTIPLGAIKYGSFQKWVSCLNFSPTRILMLEWFKEELITILFGKSLLFK